MGDNKRKRFTAQESLMLIIGKYCFCVSYTFRIQVYNH